jgi:hypothetical protein
VLLGSLSNFDRNFDGFAGLLLAALHVCEHFVGDGSGFDCRLNLVHANDMCSAHDAHDHGCKGAVETAGRAPRLPCDR